MKSVSGSAKNADGFAISDLRKKYSTCEPGVSSPSGRILGFWRFCVVPSQPVAAAGSAATHAGGNVPEPQVMLVLLVAPAVSIRKHWLCRMPRVANLGSDS